MENKYIALTLGPITRTIELAESTKELWAASYFFSYLAKNIITPFKNREFLLPLIDQCMWEAHNGAGLFPDRYIFKASDKDFSDMNLHVDHVLRNMSEDINTTLKIENGEDSIFQFLKSYLKIFFIENTFSSDIDRKQIIAQCEHDLNLLEMQDVFPAKEKINYLHSFFKQINGDPVWVKGDDKIISGFKGTFLTLDAYGEISKGGKLFESIIEISAVELNINLIERYNDTAKEKKKEAKDKYLIDAENLILEDQHIRPYHKYIAIVKADGDSMGKTIEAIHDTANLSRALLDFNKETTQIITNYGGKPVFIGGDDLLFFAPVYSCGKTIFNLIQNLDLSFSNCLEKNLPSDIPLPTLSYGVSITYFKYPMFEALSTANYLLEQLAKGRKLKEKLEKKGIKIEEIKKNNIAFAMQKHSGQMYTAMFRKHHCQSYKLLGEMIEKYSHSMTETSSQNPEEEKFLVSVMHKIREQSFTLKLIMKENSNEVLLKYFFENTFNEPIHKDYKVFFEDIQKFMLVSFKEFQKNFNDYNKQVKIEKLHIDSADETLEQVSSILRFIHFINSRNDE